MTDVELPASLQPPMANGEVIFEAPWQARTFGMAVALTEQGVIDWADMQASLIEVIAAADAVRAADAEYPYFEYFAEALQRLLGRIEIVSAAELVGRSEAIAALPHGHDH
ncbi:MAG: nitrile hydratase accessory protein [Pseudomonadota bacterium]